MGVVTDTWDEDTQTAIDLLTDTGLTPSGSCVPPPFAYDPDAAFNQAIISVIRATMAVNTLRDLVTGEILSADILVAIEIAEEIGKALQEADRNIQCANGLVPGEKVAATDLAKIIKDLNDAANGLDDDLNDVLTIPGLILFLKDQGFIVISP